MPQGIYSGYGMQPNYTNNLAYQYYMMQMMQQQQQALFAQQQQDAQMDAYYEPQGTEEQAYVQQPQRVAVPAHMATSQVQAVQQPQQADGDGKDDGKISFGKKCKNFFKGVGNFFKGMVCDENGKFSLKRTLTTLGVAAGAVVLSVATGGAATPFLIAGGAAMATYQTGKGIYKACTAKTDREAEQAWQEIGTGTTALVTTVAGAKGALKSAGVDVSAAKYSGIKGSLRATGECFKIAGKGAWNAKSALLHPMQAARSIRGYWNSTAKPNLQQAFSYKNGYKNYTKSEQAKINKNINDIEAKMSEIQSELQKPSLTDAKRAELNTKYNELIGQRTNAEVHSRYNDVMQQNGPTPSKFRDAVTKNAEQRLQAMQEQLKTATGEQKIALEADIKTLNNEIKYFKNAQERILKSEQMIAELNAEKNLPTQAHNLTSAQQARLNSIEARINTIKGAIAKDKQILRNANYKVAAQHHLPQVGLAYGSYYLGGAAPQTINDENAKFYGFESKDQMIEAAAQYGLTAEQLADAIEQQFAQQGTTAATAAQQLAAAEAERQAGADALAQQQAAEQAAAQQAAQQAAYQQYNPYASNPYGQFAYNQQAQYMGDNTFRFNELYKSPYPDMIA